MVFASAGLSAAAITRTRAWPGPGSGIGISTMRQFSIGPISVAAKARMVLGMTEPWHGQARGARAARVADVVVAEPSCLSIGTALAEALGLPGIEGEVSPVAIEAASGPPSRRPLAVALWVVVGLFAAASLAGLLLHWSGGTNGSGKMPTASVPPTSQTLPASAPSLATASPPRMPSPTPTPEAPAPNTGSAATKSAHGTDRTRAPRREAGDARSAT